MASTSFRNNLLLVTTTLCLISGCSAHVTTTQEPAPNDSHGPFTGICNSVEDGMRVASAVLHGLPHLEGPPGERGPVGPQGFQGQKGDLGEKGLKGDMGFTGAEGLTGPRGYNGFAGAKGGKGNVGNRGSQGQTGNQGSQGPRGYAGFAGGKGDKGNVGLQGARGYTGSRGFKGQKGSQNNARMSAFSVHRNAGMYAVSGTEVITFDIITVNSGGDMNINTGIFTCDIPGLYYFSYTIETNMGNIATVQLMKNGVRQNDLEASKKDGSRHIMQSQSIILSLQQSDKVNLQLYNGAKIDDTSGRRNTFNGYLIYEN